jgi:hypothetical protein
MVQPDNTKDCTTYIYLAMNFVKKATDYTHAFQYNTTISVMKFYIRVIQSSTYSLLIGYILFYLFIYLFDNENKKW